MLFWILIMATIVAASFAYAALSAAPWVPMWQRDTGRVIRILESQMQQSCVNKKCIYELGCGDGRLLSALSDVGFKGIGFEISLLPFAIAIIRKFFTRGEYKIKYKNFWSASLILADAVFFFLVPRVLPKLRNKLERELRSGSIVISYVWPIPGWTPTMVDEAPRAPKIFVYERP